MRDGGRSGAGRAGARRQAGRALRVLTRPTNIAAAGYGLALFSLAEVASRALPLPRAARWFGAGLDFSDRVGERRGSELDLSPGERRMLSVLARIARRWPLGPRGACLRHSLAAAYVLRTHDPKLRLAVGARAAAELAAHAWLEVEGVAVTNPGNFLPLLRSGG